MTMIQGGVIPEVTMAHRLRIAREYAGLEQSELAERSDMSRTAIVNYENGYRTPRRLYLRAIAEATGVDLHWLETGEAPAASATGASGTVRPEGLEPPTFWLVVADYFEGEAGSDALDALYQALCTVEAMDVAL